MPARRWRGPDVVLKVLLFAQLIYVVNQVHFPWLETGIPAVAPINLMLLVSWLIMRRQPDPLADTKPILQNAFLSFFAALTFAFLLAQVRAPRDFIDDVQYLKTALFFPLFYF